MYEVMCNQLRKMASDFGITDLREAAEAVEHLVALEKKRSQAARLADAETLLVSVWEEILNGKMEPGTLQAAVNTQIMCNRIVWKLNEYRSRSIGTYST